MKNLARILALLSLGLGALHFYRVRSAVGLVLALPKVLAGAMAPFIAVVGVAGSVLGLLSQSRLALVVGGLGALLSARYVQRTTAPHDGFSVAFGPDWQRRIAPERGARMLSRRWAWKLPPSPEPRWQRDLAFWSIPGSGRKLLCDLWQPPVDVAPSGLAFIYCHGSAWHYLDKDNGTRPFFRHLAAQGHVVMDVAYRLCPEIDVRGMLGDVKRAIVWMKHNARRYGVNPERVVLAGGSAGGHLALLAAYTPGHPQLTADDLKRADTSVRAVVSYYGPTDMRMLHAHVLPTLGIADCAETSGKARLADRAGENVADAARKLMHFKRSGVSYSMREITVNLLGGGLDEVPEMAALASPVTHVGADCPPTLLFHGDHDTLVPVDSARLLYGKLVAAGVPVVYVEFPQTEHAFDLTLPLFAPATQAALYDLDRFLALVL